MDFVGAVLKKVPRTPASHSQNYGSRNLSRNKLGTPIRIEGDLADK